MSRFLRAFTTALCMLGTLAACGPSGSINGTVTVAPGQKADDVSTVNGSVEVGDGATVGDAMTVNGSVRIGANATAQSVKTVNGPVHLGESAKLTGSIMAVNGGLTLDNGADVAGRIANVNGTIVLKAAHVGGGITTITGDIDVGRDSRVEGGIHVDKPDFSSDSGRNIPRIVIGPNAVVEGPLKFEREVDLYVHDSATIGAVEGATVQKFSGEHPGEPAVTGSSPSVESGTGNAPPAGGPEKE